VTDSRPVFSSADLLVILQFELSSSAKFAVRYE
jgi:hypothetical protein